MHIATAASPTPRTDVSRGEQSAPTRPTTWSYLALIVGILTFRLAAWTVFNGSLVAGPGTAFAVSRIAQLVGIVVLLGANLAWELSARLLQGIVNGSACAMALTALCIVVGQPTGRALIVACSVHGLASAVLIIGWGVRTCLVEPRRSAVCVAIAFALYGLVTFALSFAPTALTALLAIATPLVCGAAMTRGAIRFAGNCIPRARTTVDALRGLDWGTVGLLFACGLVCSLTDIFVAPEYGQPSTYTTNAFRVVAFAVLAVFICIWVFALKRDDPDQLWPLFASVIFFGLLGFSSFSFIDEPASVSFMRATQDCLMLFSWMFIAGLTWRHRLPPIAAFGIGTILYMRTDLPATIVRFAAPQFQEGLSSGTDIAVGLSFVMATLLIVYTIVLLGRSAFGARKNPVAGVTSEDRVQPDADPAPIHPEAPEARNALAWLEPFDLTARELQVVDLLLHGYTLPQVGQRFDVSLNTARYYAKNIYRKLGIHSKQELIELAEKHGAN